MSKAYKFEIASNRSDETMLVNGIEIYVRQMTIAQQLRLNAAREHVQKVRSRRTSETLKRQRLSARGEDPGPENDEPLPTMVEAEVAVMVPVIQSLLVNELDSDKITEEWMLDMNQEDYQRLFSILVTGEDVKPAEPEEEKPERTDEEILEAVAQAKQEAADNPNV